MRILVGIVVGGLLALAVVAVLSVRNRDVPDQVQRLQHPGQEAGSPVVAVVGVGAVERDVAYNRNVTDASASYSSHKGDAGTVFGATGGVRKADGSPNCTSEERTASAWSITPAAEGGSVGVVPEASGSVKEMSLFASRETRRQVEADLAGDKSRSRQDLLVMYGRSAAASGRFDVAAASYVMFLEEFGLEHPYSARVAMRLADSLAPVDLKSVDILHTEDGPKFDARWRMGFKPSPDSLRQAIPAYRLAAELAADDASVDRALFRIGWVYRAANDWVGATEAWDRCAIQVSGPKSRADAFWLAAENLRWMGRPAEAAERLRQMVAVCPADARVGVVAELVEYLEAEASRSADWLVDPVASIQAEVRERAKVRTPSEVYRSVVRWLQRRGDRAALIDVCRWACKQDDWPVKAQISCRYDLVDALLLDDRTASPGGEGVPSTRGIEEEARLERNGAIRHSDLNSDARLEAVDRLDEIVALVPDDARAVPAAIRCYRLLDDAGQFGRADQVMERLMTRVKTSSRWEPRVLVERAESLVARGDNEGARAVLDILAASHPDCGVAKRFEEILVGEDMEDEE